jgi:phage repressor protein C with HTH and peptisase S24 domain
MEPGDPRATLDALIRERGSDYTSLSRLLGRNAAYIQQYVKRGVPRKLDADDRRVLARYFDVDEMLLGAAPAPRSPAIVMVPRLALGASAGPGALAEGERVRDQLGFAADWLRSRGARRLEMLSVLRVSGESMIPTLADGDEILVDRGDAGDGLRDGIYVLRVDDTLMVKRVLIDPAGGFQIRSDNPAAAGGTIDAAAAQIIGRVIWFGRSLR